MSVEDFVTRTRKLLEKERDAEIEETRSLPLSTSKVTANSVILLLERLLLPPLIELVVVKDLTYIYLIKLMSYVSALKV